MLPVCFSQEVLLYQIPDIKFYDYPHVVRLYVLDLKSVL